MAEDARSHTPADSPARWSEPTEEDREALVRMLLLALLAITVAYAAVLFGLGLLDPAQLPATVFFAATTAGLLVGLGRLGWRLVGGALVGALVVAVMWATASSGTQANPGYAAVILVLAALLYGRAGVWVGLAAGIVMTVIDATLIVHSGPAEPAAHLVTTAATLVTVGVLLTWHVGAMARATEAAMRTAEASAARDLAYLELLERIPDGVAFMSTDGVVRSVTPAVTAITGYAADELVGRRFWTLPVFAEADDADEARQRFAGVLTGHRTPEGMLFVMRSRDGGEVSVEVRAQLTTDADGEPVIHAMIRDVTAREAARQAQRAYEAGLERAQRVQMLGRLAGGVAHDFNNLLMVITTNAELLRDDVPQSPELDDLVTAARAAADLTGKLLTLARAQHSQPRPHAIGSVLEGVRGVLRSLLSGEWELVVEVAPDCPAVVVDRSHLEQALVNLVVNARDAMAEGGEVHLTVRPSTPAEERAHPGHWVVFSVADAGTGIAPEHRELVFEPFFTTKGSQGTGVGLASVQSMVERAGGHIVLDTEVGAGTTFHLLLPVAPTAPDAAEPEVTGPRQGRVLLVEDIDAVRVAARRLLEAIGYSVVDVASVAAAREVLAMQSFDVVLSDVVMPVEGGLEVLRLVRERCPGVPVVLMSAHAPTWAADADGFLQKPFEAHELVAAFDACLHGGPDHTSASSRS